MSFFSGILQLLIDSGAAERVAKLLSPIFVHVFPEVPRGHPSISYMTLNFAANFLGLDSAATPFGLKAMESLQELNDQKDRASNPQIMFMCLHAAGLTLIPTSIISYRAAQHGAVVVQNLAQHARRLQACHSCQIHSGLGVTGAPQHAAVFCA